MFEFVSRVVPHLRVGGTEAGRGAGEPGCTDVGNTLIDLLSDMCSRAQVAASLAERISLTRDIALFALAFYSMRRGYDLPFTLGSHILKLPNSSGLIFNFQFGKTLKASSVAVVMLADRDCPVVCAFRDVTAYISARSGWGGT